MRRNIVVGIAALLLVAATSLAIVAAGKDGEPEQPTGLPLAEADIVVTQTRTVHDGHLYGYDWETGELVTQLGVAPVPVDIMFSDDGSYVYVTSVNSNLLSVFDSRTNALIKTVVFDGEPAGMESIPELNKLYVANPGRNKIEVLDVGNFAIVNEIQLDAPASEIARSPDGSAIYTATSGGRFIAISTANDGIMQDLYLGEGTMYPLIVSPDGDYAYIGHRLEDRVAVVNLEEFRIEKVIRDITRAKFPNGTIDGLAVSRDGKFLYVSDGQSDYIAVIDLQNNMVIERVTVRGGLGPGALAISADGRYLFSLHFGGISIEGDTPDLPGAINVIDTKTMEVIKKITVPTGPIAIALNPALELK